MTFPVAQTCYQPSVGRLVSEILILPDGKILAHNITPVMAQVLADLNPADPHMRRRSLRHNNLQNELPNRT
jgi:hypothetical protein